MFSSRSLMLATVIALAPFALQGQATTTCKDGTTSTSTGKGACSGHGGVGKGAAKAAKSDAKTSTKAAKADVKADTKADTKMAKADAKAAKKTAAPTATAAKTTASTDANGATAKCKDGTYSHAASRRGACSKHGGVAEWLKT